jgi:hypothetical protein
MSHSMIVVLIYREEVRTMLDSVGEQSSPRILISISIFQLQQVLRQGYGGAEFLFFRSRSTITMSGFGEQRSPINRRSGED